MFEAATTNHVAEASSRLRELCEIVSTTELQSPRATINVRVGHYDHGGFLSLNLHGFSVFQTPESHLSWRGPDNTLLYAVVVTLPVPTQAKTLLSFLTNLLARQGFTESLRSHEESVSDLYAKVSKLNTDADQEIADAEILQNHKSTAVQLMERFKLAGIQLDVSFESPLLRPDEIRERCAVLRYVYNSLPLTRMAVDRTASAMARSMRLDGDGVPQDVLLRAQQGMDNLEVGKYVSTAMRDAFVCGNSFTLFTETPGIRLLRPESVEIRDDGAAFVETSPPAESLTHDGDKVMHITGAAQVGSPYGASLLEPFVQLMVPVDTALDGLRELENHESHPLLGHYKDRFREYYDMALVERADRERQILGNATDAISSPAAETYFPGAGLMSTDVTILRFREDGQ